MTRPILNIADVEYRDWGHGERFAAKLGDVAQRIGAQKLGYNVTVVPPGKISRHGAEPVHELRLTAAIHHRVLHWLAS